MEEASHCPRLLEYLAAARTAAKAGRACRFVLGNEAADLDSMVTAIATGYYLGEVAPDGGPPFVPLVNAPRADFKLRTEAVYLLGSVGVGPELLCFADEVALEVLHSAGQLALVLVDHNALAAGQAGLADAVVGVLDHHHDEGGFRDAPWRVIEPVGSAATLVAETLLQHDPAAVEPGLARLLLGTILLDTVNLEPQAQRATAKDVAIAERLARLCSADREVLFARLQFEKFNVAALDSADLLRKDYKEYRMGEVRCGIASVLLSAQAWQQKDPELGASLARFGADRRLDLLLAMNAWTDPEFRRDLVVWAADETLFGRVLEFLCGTELGLTPLEDGDGGQGSVALFSQANAAYSRKKLQPLLQEFLG